MFQKPQTRTTDYRLKDLSLPALAGHPGPKSEVRSRHYTQSYPESVTRHAFRPTATSSPEDTMTVSDRLHAFLSGHLGERITLKELSRFLGYSEKYASDVFHRYMGLPFSQHLKQLRLDKATSMLMEEGYTIAGIAESVGFSDAFAFSHFFKRAIGCSPSEFRRQHLRQASAT